MTARSDRGRAIDLEAGRLAARLRGVMSGAQVGAVSPGFPQYPQQAQGQQHSVQSPPPPYGNEFGCGAPGPSCVAGQGIFTSGGRLPAASAQGTIASPVEQHVFDWTAREELCRLGDPSFVATVAVRLATSVETGGAQDVATNDWSTAFIRCVFGSGNSGSDAYVDFDVMNGSSIPLVGRRASFYLVYPVNTGSEQAPITNPLIDVSISVGIAPGNSAGVRGAKKTIRIGGVNQNATSAIFPVPRYAASASYTSSDPGNQTTINFQASPLAGAPNIAVNPLLSKLESNASPVPTGARGFSVTAAINMSDVRVVFLLNPA